MQGTPELEAEKTAAPPRVVAPTPRLAPWREGNPLRVGVLSGRGYRNLRGGLEKVSRYLDRLPNVPHRIVRDPAETAAALDEFAASGTDVIAVNGGDGTVSMVATYLLKGRSGPPPLLAIIEGGRTNMTAGDVGIRGQQVRRLQHLLAWAQSSTRRDPKIVRRSVIEVDAGDGTTSCGFFVGGAAVYKASLDAWKTQKKKKIPLMHTGLGTATSVVKQLTAHVVSRSAWEPTNIRLDLDGHVVDQERWCVLFATTLQRMALGIDPFWGEESGAIRVTAVTHDHKKLFRSAVAGLRGKPNRHLGEENGYYSFNAERVECRLDSCLTLDGEVVRPANGVVRLGSAGSLDFLRI